MIINRLAKKLLADKLQPGKVILLYGPRRVGKTTLLNEFIQNHEAREHIKIVNGETTVVQATLSVQNIESLRRFVGDSKVIIIDEAQKIPQIGQSLKIIVDNFPDVSVIASGSASFSLARQVGEPLTGRQKIVNLFPISAAEIIETKGLEYFQESLEDLLVFGCYPELFSINDRTRQEEYLHELVNSYLFKDILELENIRYANKYFWRTYDQKEIDWVEERDGKLFGYEFKWGNKSGRPPSDWTTAYPGASFETITRGNMIDFIV